MCIFLSRSDHMFTFTDTVVLTLRELHKIQLVRIYHKTNNKTNKQKQVLLYWGDAPFESRRETMAIQLRNKKIQLKENRNLY